MRDEKQQQELHRILDELRKPFHPSNVIWKPGAVKGERAMALAYADLRAYMNRLDDVCGADWSVAYEPWGDDRIICRLTILDVTRSSTGEMSKESERSEIGGTVAEAQAMKRACAMFGLGRYLYNLPSGWADFDPATKKFTDKAKAKLMGILVQHYRRATENPKGELADIFQNATDAPQPPATTQRATTTPSTPHSPATQVEGDVGDEGTDGAPTDEEHDIISQWDGPRDAQNYALMVGACDNEHHASESWMASVKACRGYSAKNKQDVFLHFLRHQREKMNNGSGAVVIA